MARWRHADRHFRASMRWIARRGSVVREHHCVAGEEREIMNERRREAHDRAVAAPVVRGVAVGARARVKRIGHVDPSGVGGIVGSRGRCPQRAVNRARTIPFTSACSSRYAPAACGTKRCSVPTTAPRSRSAASAVAIRLPSGPKTDLSSRTGARATREGPHRSRRATRTP